jgi:hypothetical protein
VIGTSTVASCAGTEEVFLDKIKEELDVLADVVLSIEKEQIRLQLVGFCGSLFLFWLFIIDKAYWGYWQISAVCIAGVFFFLTTTYLGLHYSNKKRRKKLRSLRLKMEELLELERKDGVVDDTLVALITKLKREELE